MWPSARIPGSRTGSRYVTPALSGADITPVEWNSRSSITVPRLMPYPVQISGSSFTFAAF